MQRARTELSKENRKQFILDCAEKLILEEGLPHLSIARVAKKSKLAVGTIYLYFERKEDIIAQLTLKSRELLLAKFEAYSASKTEAPDQIAQIMLAFYDFYRDNPFYGQLVSFYETNAGLQESPALQAASLQITQLVADIVTAGQTAGTVRPEINPQQFSFWIWGSTVGIIQLLEVKNQAIEKTLNMTGPNFFQHHIQQVISTLRSL